MVQAQQHQIKQNIIKNKKVYSVFLALSIIVLFCSCNKTELGNIEIFEQNTTRRFDNLRIYFVGFKELNLEVDIILRNKVSNKDSILFENIIENEVTNNNVVIRDLTRDMIIWNQILLDIEDLTTVVIPDINSSQFISIVAEKNKNKIDISVSLRISRPEFNVGHKNDVSY